MLYCGSNNRYTQTDVYDITIRQYADTTTTVTDEGDYYKISVTNNEPTDLTDYQVQVDAASLGITSDNESWKFIEKQRYINPHTFSSNYIGEIV